MGMDLKTILPISTGTVIEGHPKECSSLQAYPLARTRSNSGEGEASAEGEARDAPALLLAIGPRCGGERGPHLRVTRRAVVRAVRLHQLAPFAVSDGCI